MIKRNTEVDFLKMVMAIFVVYGHVMNTSIGIYGNKMAVFICSFHMPMFMLLTGYTSYYSHKDNSFKKLIKRSISLIIPIITWGSLFYFYQLFWGYKELGLFQWLYAVTEEGLWFLYAVIILQWLMAITLVFSKKYRIVIWVVFFVLCLFSVEFIQPMRMITYMYPYYGAGFLFHLLSDTDNDKKCVNGFWEYLILFLAVIFPILLLVFQDRDYIYSSGMAISKSPFGYYQIVINVYRYFLGFSGCAYCYVLTKALFRILSDEKKQFLALGGRYSLELYCVQGIIIDIFQRLFSPIRTLISNEWMLSVGYCIPVTLISFSVSLIFVGMTRKSDVLYYILFGRRPTNIR